MTLALNSNGINGFVLAGGKSARMGRDKAALDWQGRTLLEHMMGLLSTVSDQVRVVGRPPLPDFYPNRGPLGGIATALEVSETDANLVVAVDLPLLTPEFLKYFRMRFEKSDRPVVTCLIESRYPLCLGVRKAALGKAEKQLETGDRSVQSFLTACSLEIILELELRKAGFDTRIFRNINTPDDHLNAGR